MIIDKTMVPITELRLAEEYVPGPDTLLLDIETTGISPEKNRIYCIGCSRPVGEGAEITLYFAESPAGETEIMEAFSRSLRGVSRVVTFNGTTFDLPFLHKRYAALGMEDPLQNMESLDLFQETQRLKPLLRLSDCRQKTVERFLGIAREDPYSGRELIRVYRSCAREPREESLNLLLQHNRDDVKGMYGLLNILSYRDLLDGNYRFLKAEPERNPDTGGWHLDFFLRPEIPFPRSVRLYAPAGKLLLEDNRAMARFPIHFGDLRHYFPDYRNYYYLPEEQTVIHKSVGAYVDAAHRRPAARGECWVRKHCAYLRLPVPCADSYLRMDARDRGTYADLSGYFSFPEHPENRNASSPGTDEDELNVSLPEHPHSAQSSNAKEHSGSGRRDGFENHSASSHSLSAITDIHPEPEMISADRCEPFRPFLQAFLNHLSLMWDPPSAG